MNLRHDEALWQLKKYVQHVESEPQLRNHSLNQVTCKMVYAQLAAELAFIIAAFRPLFSQRVWRCAHVLLIGGFWHLAGERSRVLCV
jgi:hypothetical protein